MATFSVGQPITTKTSTITVDAGLPVGSHRFQLEVTDNAGNRSKADVAVVTVQREVIPGPLDPRPTIPLPGTVVDPVLTGPRPTVVTPTVVSPTVVSPSVVRPTVVTPRRPKPPPGSKRSKPK